MNGITNLPQFYQDIMRSPFAAAAAAAHFAAAANTANNNNIQQIDKPPSTSMQQMSSTNHQMIPLNAQKNQYHQQQQQHPSQQFVNQMMQQQNLMAALQQHHNFNNSSGSNFQPIFRPQSPNNTSNNITPSSSYPYSSKQVPFYPSMDQVKSTINSLYFQQHQSQNIILENMMQIKQQNAVVSRGRGRPKRDTNTTTMQTNDDLNKNNAKASYDTSTKSLSPSVMSHASRRSVPNSPGSPNISVTSDHESRSRSPVSRSTKRSLNKKSNSSETNSTSTTARTSTPSKLISLNTDHSLSNGNNKRFNYTTDEISEAGTATEGVDDEDTHTEVYSSIFDDEEEENTNIEDEEVETIASIDDCNLEELDEELEDELLDEFVNEEDMNESDADTDLNKTNTTATGGNSSKLSNSNNKKSSKIASLKKSENKMTISSTKSTKMPKNSIKKDENSSVLNDKQQNLNKPLYDFTLQALEMSLYGYLRQQQSYQDSNEKLFTGHSISGIRMPTTFQQNQQMNSFQQQQLLANNSNFNLFQNFQQQQQLQNTKKGWLLS